MALDIFKQEDFEDYRDNNDKSLKITDIKQAIKNPNRVNIFINGKYRFSLDIFQLTTLGIKIGASFTEDEIKGLEQQSEFGKLYALSLNYCLMRPHSEKEVRDYLWKKTLPKKIKNKKTGELYEKKGVSTISAEQVLERLKEKKYIDDEKFTRFWVENRNQRKGISMKKIKSELFSKGVSNDIIEKILSESNRSDREEILKIIEKKSRKYSDRNKFVGYLARQGFSYDDINKVLEDVCFK